MKSRSRRRLASLVSGSEAPSRQQFADEYENAWRQALKIALEMS